MQILISGMGIISALGNGVDQNYKRLYDGSTGISQLQHLESRHKGKLFVGEVQMSDQELLNEISVNSSGSFKTRVEALAYIACQEAIKDAKISEIDIKNHRIGLISSSTVGGLRNTEKYFKDFHSGKTTKRFISSHSVAESTKSLAEHFGLKDYNATINTACSSSSNALILGSRLIENDCLDIVIVGGVDVLSKYTINGFNSLLLLDSDHCKPFDENRRGINLGEGAGYIVLESAKNVSKRKVNAKAELRGYSSTSDAFHISATSPDGNGIFNAMKLAMEMANITPMEVDFIHAHGTGTKNNDLTEGIAINRAFPDSVPSFSSSKSFTGHCLGSAGSINIIFSILAMNNNFVFPNLNFLQPIKEHELSPQNKTEKKSLNHVLNNAIGMGGFCSSVVISKC